MPIPNGGLKIGGTDQFCDFPAVTSHAWKSEGMYKEVNRSLIKWPVAASATMLAMSWFPMDPALDNFESSGVSGISTPIDVYVVPESNDVLVVSSAVVTPHGEQASTIVADEPSVQPREVRALQLSESVAGVSGDQITGNETAEAKAAEGLSAVLKAPVRLIDQELAGLGLGKTKKGLSGATSAVAEIATERGMTRSEAEELLILAQFEHFEWGSVSWILDPWSADFWQPDSDLASFVSQKSLSGSRDSDLTSGTQEVMGASQQDLASRPSWADASEGVRSRLHTATESCNELLLVMARKSEKLKAFVAKHQLELSLKAGANAIESQAAVVIPVGGVISAEDEIAIPQVQQSVSRNVSSDRLARKERVAAWPEAKQLGTQLSQLAEMSTTSDAPHGIRFISLDGTELTIADWASQVQELLSELRSLPRLGDEDAGAILVALNGLAAEGRAQAELLDDRQCQLHWLRASYAISRRTAIWMPVWSLSKGQKVSWDTPRIDIGLQLETAVQRVRDDLMVTGDVKGWTAFLLLDEMLEQAKSGTAASRAILSQRVMSRLQWHSLANEQSRWLQRDSIDLLVTAIRPWAHTVVDYATLLNQLEKQEANAIDLSAVEIASAAQSLRFASSPAAVKIADEINTHYRNANVRVAVSERFMERMIPAIGPTRKAVNTQMMGARVSGVSQIQSDFDIDLEPASDRWLLALKANGRVETDSVGRQGVVSVRTAASAKFDAASHIEVTKRGLYLGDAEAMVKGSTRLRGVETAYDGWPLVGTLVRSIAEERFRGMAPQANRIANREARVQIESEMDAQIETRVDEAAGALTEMVLGPLGRLQLDPCVTDMQTTEHRLLARYRVAGDWQLGAFTPRPRALSDSLMSVQLHQSALNNTLEQLIPSDQTIGIRDLIRRSVGAFGNTDVDIPSDIPADVSVQFARTRPITVEIEDGMLWLTLRVLRLRRDEGIDLTQFIVRVGYRPEIDGLNARLVRDGHLRISGPRMAIRERLPVRAIFNKVFATSREIPLTVPRLIENPATDGLVVSQLELRDGWLAMAISEEGAARIALRQE